MRGRKPTALAVARSAGFPGKRPARRELAIRHVRPDLPKWATADGKKFLETVLPELERTDQLTVVDGASLADLGECYVDLVYWRNELAKEKRKKGADRTEIKNLQREVRRASDAFRKWAMEYGLTSVSRTRLAVRGGPAARDEDDSEDELD